MLLHLWPWHSPDPTFARCTALLNLIFTPPGVKAYVGAASEKAGVQGAVPGGVSYVCIRRTVPQVVGLKRKQDLDLCWVVKCWMRYARQSARPNAGHAHEECN